MSAAGSSTSSAPGSGLCCVLWHPAGAQIPSELLNSLTRRIGRIVACSDSMAAMANVCALERDRGARTRDFAKDPTAQGSGTVLLLVEPQNLADAVEVVEAVRLYAPGAVCWKYAAAANPKMSAVVESDVKAWIAATADEPKTPEPRPAPARPAPPPGGTPRLRLAGDPAEAPLPEIVIRPQRAAASGGPGPSRPARPLTLRGEGPTPEQSPRASLSPEELRMLLGEDVADGENPRGREGGER